MFGTYHVHDWEILAEYLDIDHDFDATGAASSFNASSNGWSVQVGHRMEDWMPYVRYDSVSLDNSDTSYDNLDDRGAASIGVRWVLSNRNPAAEGALDVCFPRPLALVLLFNPGAVDGFSDTLGWI